MSGRYRTVALQALGVAVLAAFVFVAFLRPSEPGDLSKIDAPGGGEGPTVSNRPDNNKAQKHDKGTDGSDGLGAPRADSNELAPDTQGSDTLTPPDGDGGPDDDQYTDLATVLMEKVGRPALFREIEP